MSKSRLAIATALCTSVALLATQTLAQTAAARMTSVDGPIMVNQGAGFTPLTDRTVLKAGDRILSSKGAHGNLVYANGCTVPLKGAALLTVTPGAECAKSQVVVADSDRTGDVFVATPWLIALIIGGATAVSLGAAAAAGAFGKSG
jgi:hypothetical protein